MNSKVTPTDADTFMTGGCTREHRRWLSRRASCARIVQTHTHSNSHKLIQVCAPNAFPAIAIDIKRGDSRIWFARSAIDGYFSTRALFDPSRISRRRVKRAEKRHGAPGARNARLNVTKLIPLEFSKVHQARACRCDSSDFCVDAHPSTSVFLRSSDSVKDRRTVTGVYVVFRPE